ncbi:phospholipase D family protein [Halalkalibacter kiskunsagensis]|uniref:phospholipase D n=1 Tax=Halalkalibacter kiskunsagensis TaxID=1548599 RepID=A0ABV6KAY8_9BACI
MPELEKKPILNRTQNKWVYWLSVCLAIVVFLVIFGLSYVRVTSPPEGISYEGDVHFIDEVEFLTDNTYEKNGEVHYEQEIFDRVYDMIESAEKFILLDMFLFNDEYDREMDFQALSEELANTLIAAKKRNEELHIVVITDRINTFYGSYQSDIHSSLQENGITVIYTNMKPLRDSNPIYSLAWRKVVQWFGTPEGGWLPNPFSPDSDKATVRSYLELLNFKANHRKVIVTEKQGMVTSANPHDASSLHSNIAFLFDGDILEELIETEVAVAKLAGFDLNELINFDIETNFPSNGQYEIQLLTEGKIKKHLIQEVSQTIEGDQISVGAFYLSDRDVMKELLAASKRNVRVRLILDANNDAFGREKNGIPNRSVASELIKKSNSDIEIRWYKTNGEQYHTKLVYIDKEKNDVLLGGSANFTKRNLADYNLETNVKITADSTTEMMQEVNEYFETLWTNDQATYTADYEEFADESYVNQLIYRFQEWSGMSTF